MSQDDLRRIKAAFACMTDAELDAISGATYGLPQIARGLLAWLDSACVWQLRHRAGHNEDLQTVGGAIPPEADPISLEAAIALRVSFATKPAVRAAFDAPLDLLTESGQKH